MVTQKQVKTWMKNNSVIGIPLLFALFIYLASIGNIQITGYSGDMACAGNELDPCYAYINFTALKSFSISPINESVWIFKVNEPSKIRQLILQKKSGNNWNTMNLSKTNYFTKNLTYKLRIVGYKYNPADTVKWSFANVDPYWNGTTTISLTLDSFDGDRNYELGSNVTIYSTLANYTDSVCIDIAGVGNNISCVNATTSNLSYVWTSRAVKTTFNDSTSAKNLTYAPGNQTSYFRFHAYDHLDNFTMNLKGFASSGVYPTNISIWLQSNLSNVLYGTLQGTMMNLTFFNNSRTNETAIFGQYPGSFIRYATIPNITVQNINLTVSRGIERHEWNIPATQGYAQAWPGNGSCLADYVNYWQSFSAHSTNLSSIKLHFIYNGTAGNPSVRIYLYSGNCTSGLPSGYPTQLGSATWTVPPVTVQADSEHYVNFTSVVTLTEGNKYCYQIQLYSPNYVGCGTGVQQGVGLYFKYSDTPSDCSSYPEIQKWDATYQFLNKSFLPSQSGYFTIAEHSCAELKAVTYPRRAPQDAKLEIGVNDNNPEWNYTGTFDNDNLTVKISNLTPINNYLSTCSYDRYGNCQVPFIFGNSINNTAITYADLYINYTIPQIRLNHSLWQNYLDNQTPAYYDLTLNISSSTAGVLELSNITIDYQGSGTANITAHSSDRTISYSHVAHLYYSRFNYSFPLYVNYLEFIPDTPASKNVSAYGQTDDVPVFNFTTKNYDKNMDIYFKINSVAYINNTYGLVGYWKLDEGTGTNSKNQISAKPNITLGVNVSWVVGKYNNSIFTNASKLAAFATIPYNESYNLNKTGRLTVMAWIKTVSDQTATHGCGGWSRIIEKGGYNVGDWDLICQDVDNQICAEIWNVGDANRMCTIGFTNNTWVHAAFTFDGTTMRTYTNGISTGVPITIASYSNTTSVISLGARSSGANHFTGSIDDIKIYNRALSAQEVYYEFAQRTCVNITASSSNILNSQNKTTQDRLIAWWDMNNNATVAIDSIGGNNGTVNGAFWNSSGKYGSAFTFDGINDNVDMGSGSITNITTGKITMSAWVYLNALSNDFQNIISKEMANNGTVYTGYEIFKSNLNKIRCLFTNDLEVLSTSAIQTNTWYLVTCTHNGSVGSLYINGVLNNTGTLVTDSNSFTSGYSLKIGSRSDGNYLWNGTIDEVKIFNRELTADEVMAEYQMNHVTLNTNWQTLTALQNLNLTNSTYTWLYGQYDCSYPTWNLYNPTFEMKGCCRDCICNQVS